MAEASTPLTAPAATATAAPGAAAATAAAPASTPAPDFAREWNLAPEAIEFIGKAGYKTPADMVTSTMATQRMKGYRPEDVIVKPKEGDSAARLATFKALGAPESPKDYGFTLPEGGDPKFKEAAETWLHANGIPKPEATALYDAWNKYASERIVADSEAREAQRVAEYQAFREKTGQGFGRLEAEARAAAREAELTPEEGLALENELGVERATTLMAKLGRHFVEAAFKTGDQEKAGVFGTTAEAAQAEKDMLFNDRAWVTRWNNGDVDARKRMAALDSIIADARATPATANATPAMGGVAMSQRPRTATF